MSTIDAEFLCYFVGGWALVSGIITYRLAAEKFLHEWFQLFSGFLGIWAIFGVVFFLLATHPNIMLTVFWVGVIGLAIIGSWASRRERRDQDKHRGRRE